MTRPCPAGSVVSVGPGADGDLAVVAVAPLTVVAVLTPEDVDAFAVVADEPATEVVVTTASPPAVAAVVSVVLDVSSAAVVVVAPPAPTDLAFLLPPPQPAAKRPTTAIGTHTRRHVEP